MLSCVIVLFRLFYHYDSAIIIIRNIPSLKSNSFHTTASSMQKTSEAFFHHFIYVHLLLLLPPLLALPFNIFYLSWTFFSFIYVVSCFFSRSGIFQTQRANKTKQNKTKYQFVTFCLWFPMRIGAFIFMPLLQFAM